jgi:hypothetical protein
MPVSDEFLAGDCHLSSLICSVGLVRGAVSYSISMAMGTGKM